MRNDEALIPVLEARNIMQTVKRVKANWTGHILLRNCLLKHIIEGKIEGRIEVKGRRGRRLLDDLEEKRGFCRLKMEALNRPLWRTRFEMRHGTPVRLRNE